MDRNHPRHLRTMALLAVALAAVALAPGLMLLTLSVVVGVLLGTVLLGSLAFFAVRHQVRRVLKEQTEVAGFRVVDGVIVEVR